MRSRRGRTISCPIHPFVAVGESDYTSVDRGCRGRLCTPVVNQVPIRRDRDRGNHRQSHHLRATGCRRSAERRARFVHRRQNKGRIVLTRRLLSVIRKAHIGVAVIGNCSRGILDEVVHRRILHRRQQPGPLIRKKPALKRLVASKDKAAWKIDIKRQHVRCRQTTAERGRTGQPHYVVHAVGRTAVDRVKSEQLKVEIQTTRRNHLRRRQDSWAVPRFHQARSTYRSDRAGSAQLGAIRYRHRPCGVESPVHHQLARIHRRGTAEGALTIQRRRSGSLLVETARPLDHPVKLRIHRTTDRQISTPQLDRSSNPVHSRKLLAFPIKIQNGPSRLNHGTC